jgi:hypothetical protein
MVDHRGRLVNHRRGEKATLCGASNVVRTMLKPSFFLAWQRGKEREIKDSPFPFSLPFCPFSTSS